MNRRTALVTAVFLAIALAGCELLFGSPMLDIRVSNASDDDATVTVIQSLTGIDELFTTRVPAGADETISVERPGPDPWTILVDDVPVTDSSQWPSDNPTIDFSIHIGPDGSVEIIDD